MSRRRHFSVLVVREDGARVLRFRFPQALIVVGLLGFVATSAVAGVLAADWLQLRRMTSEARYVEKITEQRAALHGMNQRIARLGREVADWRDIHVRLFEAFGPHATPGASDKGIGGRAAPVDRRSGRLSPRDDLDRLAESIAEESQNLKSLDRLMARAGKVLAALPSRWPVRGPVNSEFGTRLSPWTKTNEFHSGMDIRAEKGTPVRAPAGASVSFAGSHPEYGLTIVLDHGQDIRSVYGHLSKINVAVGERVERGAEIGLTGNSGRSSGPHLHYEILVQGQPTNPRGYLWD